MTDQTGEINNSISIQNPLVEGASVEIQFVREVSHKNVNVLGPLLANTIPGYMEREDVSALLEKEVIKADWDSRYTAKVYVPTLESKSPTSEELAAMDIYELCSRFYKFNIPMKPVLLTAKDSDSYVIPSRFSEMLEAGEINIDLETDIYPEHLYKSTKEEQVVVNEIIRRVENGTLNYLYALDGDLGDITINWTTVRNALAERFNALSDSEVEESTRLAQALGDVAFMLTRDQRSKKGKIMQTYPIPLGAYIGENIILPTEERLTDIAFAYQLYTIRIQQLNQISGDRAVNFDLPELYIQMGNIIVLEYLVKNGKSLNNTADKVEAETYAKNILGNINELYATPTYKGNMSEDAFFRMIKETVFIIQSYHTSQILYGAKPIDNDAFIPNAHGLRQKINEAGARPTLVPYMFNLRGQVKDGEM